VRGPPSAVPPGALNILRNATGGRSEAAIAHRRPQPGGCAWGGV